MKKQGEQTQKELVKKALEMLGGKAHVQQIYPVATKLIGKNTRAKNIKASIRRELNSSPLVFKATPDEEGYWELLSFQEEIAVRDKENAELEAEVDRLKSVPTEDDFIHRLLEKLVTTWKDDKKTIGEIRKILDAMGRLDVVKDLDERLKAIEKQTKRSKKSDSSSFFINGDYVIDKYVEHEVNGVASGGTGVSIHKDKE